MAELPFYVYVLRRPCGAPFYVGMGQGIRVHMHERVARSADRSEKSHIIRKIWATGGKVLKTIEARYQTSELAKEAEIAMIAKFGRKDLKTGPLVNRTDGGDGSQGLSAEMRELHRLRTREAMNSPEMLERCRLHMARVRTDPVAREKMDSAVREHWRKPENRIAQAARTAAFAAENPDVLAIASAKRIKSLAKADVKEKMRNAKLGKKQSAEVIEKRVAAILLAGKPPDFGARISAGKLKAKMNRLAEALL